MALNFTVLSAAVWNPAGTLNLPSKTPFPLTVFCDENPSTKGIALPIKRKISLLSKSAILTATACGNALNHGNGEDPTSLSTLHTSHLSNIPYVFASRWGEWAREINLLFERTETGIVSQGGFALSVHNTAPSLFSLTYKNRSNYTAISAGTETLEAALLQAAMWLNDHEKVLLTFGEEPPADQPGVAMKIQAGTLSLILARGNDFSLGGETSSSPVEAAGTQNSLEGTPISIENLLDFLAGTQNSAQNSLAGTTISLTKSC